MFELSSSDSSINVLNISNVSNKDRNKTTPNNFILLSSLLSLNTFCKFIGLLLLVLALNMF